MVMVNECIELDMWESMHDVAMRLDNGDRAAPSTPPTPPVSLG